MVRFRLLLLHHKKDHLVGDGLFCACGYRRENFGIPRSSCKERETFLFVISARLASDAALAQRAKPSDGPPRKKHPIRTQKLPYCCKGVFICLYHVRVETHYALFTEPNKRIFSFTTSLMYCTFKLRVAK